MEQPVQILLIEDSPLFVKLTRGMLADAKGGDFGVESVDNLAAGIARLAKGGIDAVLLDLTLPDSVGLDTFLRLHAAAPTVPTVIYTSVDDEALSLSALDHGAADYLVKSEVNANWLAKSLLYAIQRGRKAELAGDAATPGERPAEHVFSTSRSAESDNVWVVKVGEKRLVSAAVLEQLKTCLLGLVRRSDCHEVGIDMSHVDYISNAAISMLLIVHKRCSGAGKHLVLRELKRQVHEQFTSRRFDKLFDLRPA